jgi:hypothetical protein
MDVIFPPTIFRASTKYKFPRKHGPGRGYAYGIFLPPTNPGYARRGNAWWPNLAGWPWSVPGVYMPDQFWATAAYALVQVSYVGSFGWSGYGKEYMNIVNLQWGVSDIADAVSCVEYLVNDGLIDSKRVGHSAGGYAPMHN